MKSPRERRDRRLTARITAADRREAHSATVTLLAIPLGEPRLEDWREARLATALPSRMRRTGRLSTGMKMARMQGTLEERLAALLRKDVLPEATFPADFRRAAATAAAIVPSARSQPRRRKPL